MARKGGRETGFHPPANTTSHRLMSPRKTILKELSRVQEERGEPSFTRPSELTGFGERPEKYQKAVNELLQARLVEGRRDEDGRMAIALNAHRIRDVKKEIRPVWAHPAVWAVLALALAAIGAGIAI